MSDNGNIKEQEKRIASTLRARDLEGLASLQVVRTLPETKSFLEAEEIEGNGNLYLLYTPGYFAWEMKEGRVNCDEEALLTPYSNDKIEFIVEKSFQESTLGFVGMDKYCVLLLREMKPFFCISRPGLIGYGVMLLEQ